MKHKRNIEGLLESAKKKHVKKVRRSRAAIRLMRRKGCPINFMTVSKTAKVSTAFLYQQKELREEIIHLRDNATSVKVVVPSKERASEASKDAMMAAMRERIKSQDDEIKQLKRKVEVAYGQLAARK